MRRAILDKSFAIRVPILALAALSILSLLYVILLYVSEIPLAYYQLHTIITLTLIALYFAFLNRYALKYRMVFVLLILVYYFFTHFGMCMVYWIIDKTIEQQFGGQGAFYLYDEFYLNNLSMALLGFMCTVLGAILAIKRNQSPYRVIIGKLVAENRIISWIGMCFLLVTAIYFSYYMATGKISIGMDYSLYRSSGVLDGIYEWIIVFYMFGACFVYSTAERCKLKLGMALFFYTAAILLAFGNRGEVLYPLLACFGIYVSKKNKIPFKLIMLSLIIVFAIIPFVKLFRHMGDVSFEELFTALDYWNGIAEMGVSFRMTTYIMNELSSGTRELLHGFSYINPLVNILDHFVPFSIRLTPPDSFSFTNEFYAMKSMTSVAESYANFKAWGVAIHHIIMGYIITSLERNDYTKDHLALTASIASIFIYSIRARIQSVPIEILVCLFIYVAVKYSSSTFKCKY